MGNPRTRASNFNPKEKQQTSAKPNCMEHLPANLREVLEQEGIGEDQLSHRHSDLYIESDDPDQLARIAQAGQWKSMSEKFTSEVNGKPTLEIGLALIGMEISAGSAQQKNESPLDISQIESLKGEATPLYNRYPGQTEAQRAYLEMDEEGRVTADYNSEIGNAIPMEVATGRTLRIPVPNDLTGNGLAEFVEDIKPDLEKVHKGHAIDGNKGVLSEEAKDTLDRIPCGYEYERAYVVEAGDWYKAETYDPSSPLHPDNIVNLSGEQLTELAKNLDADSQTNSPTGAPMVIEGTKAYLHERRELAREQMEQNKDVDNSEDEGVKL